MSAIRVVIKGSVTPAAETRPAPVDRARRWQSPYEGGQLHGWPAIFLSQAAYRQIRDHTHSDVRHEVGGMLVGHHLQTPEGRSYIIVEAAMPAYHVRHSSAHLTFTTATLNDLLNRLGEQHPDQQIVGWYHTHPGLSIFMSSMDVWLHRHFFSEPWHVALVIDPLAEQAGFFRYRDGGNDYLHPERYVGFYEVLDEGAGSVIAWRNLFPDKQNKIGALEGAEDRAEGLNNES